MANPKTDPSSSKSSSGQVNQLDQRIENFVDLVRGAINKLKELIEQRKWVELIVYTGSIVCVLFVPKYGPFWHIIESANLISQNRYNFIFFGILFLLFFICIMLKIVQFIKNSIKGVRFFFCVLAAILILIVFNLLSVQLQSIPGEMNDRLSGGEESLFDRNSPESVIFSNNRSAVDTAVNLFSRPFKIAIALPINWANGNSNALEILRGAAIAQEEWNASPEHKSSQMFMVIADDGYDDHENTKVVAKEVARELVKNNDILGVIGHFTSGATQVTSSVYKDSEVVLISPTSTAVRCAGEDDRSTASCLDLNEYVFRTAINEDQAIDNLLAYASRESEGVKKFAVIYEADSDYSRLYKKVFIEKIENVHQFEVVNPVGDLDKCNASNLSRFDPVPCFEYIKSEDVDALLLVPSTKNNIWVERVIELNQEDKYRFDLFGSDSMYQEAFVNVNGKAREETEGMLIPLSWHRSVTNRDVCTNKSLELECKAAKIFSEEDRGEEFRPLGINWRTATGYDAAQALFNAIESVNQHKCGLQKYTGRRSACVKNHLQAELSEISISEEGKTSQDTIEFINGDRSGTEGTLVQATSGNFLIAPGY